MAFWPLRAVDDSAVNALATAAGLPVPLARFLWLRGVRDPVSASDWLEPGLSKLHPVMLLPDMPVAVERLQRAVARREPVLVWGHDDLDGITAATILVRLFGHLRLPVRYYIPAKGVEPHGINPPQVLRLFDGQRGLLVTVDCGITNHRQIAELAGSGIETIVTDHHELTSGLTPAVANVDAKRPDSKYPYRGLAAAGVAFKLAVAVAEATIGLSCRELISALPELVALAVLGTVADRVPLTGENRSLVAGGMPMLESCQLPAIRAVVDRLRDRGGKLTLQQFVSALLPLFAAASGNEGVSRFLSATPDEAEAWVDELARRRDEWRAEVERSFELADRAKTVGDGIVFARSPDLSLRTLGSCAARFKERLQLPAIVLGRRGDVWVGEGRGMDGVSLIELLKAHAGFFIDYGGHRAAAGFTIADEQLDGFLRSAEAYAHEHFAGSIFRSAGPQADALLPLRDLRPEYFRLGPFGDGNPQPVFVSGPVRLGLRGQSLYPVERPELTLWPGVDVDPMTERPVEIAYTIDDEGRVTVLGQRFLPD